MLSTRKHTERWQRLTNGYGKYWYFKSFVRWVSLITAAVNLIVFGAVWRDYAQYYYGENAQIGMWAFAIACPLFSAIVHAFAIVSLFRMRKSSNFNPGLLLAGDIMAVLFLAVDLVFTGPRLYFETSSWTPERIISICWGLSVAGGALHVIPFFTGIWETHVYRGMRREQKTGASGKNLDLDDDVQEIHATQTTSKELEAATPRNAVAHSDGVFRVELPDGRIFELPEGCKVELPADHRVELPEHPRGVFLCELEAPTFRTKA
ncbi:hypothetical protein D6D05_07556 [Aureobasidium pullulans]|uniref:Uncharacterized protein n=1 Tax=Aureobasidium pullulans TaxID=5580 RepID=A0A4S8TFU9_AURPU|nr:hypothetical protein D6D27_08270 [Aureobasidium pullulans]THW30983.1 hypothetical protein D6D22_10436 [Aureobasidium pullulans]THX24554.1 hypothetical protein D6D12_07560 [Aureobasidium pullulans]THX54263.1 hypothetical protein D6D11_04202 [Aureobasidium pullulans]THX73086.1 hypothetical protein D6D05_07556 [Aureobasidium pullulans]